jgi:hypothetical protein
MSYSNKNLCNSFEALEMRNQKNRTHSGNKQRCSSSTLNTRDNSAFPIDLYANNRTVLDKSVVFKNWHIDPAGPLGKREKLRYPELKPLKAEDILKLISPGNKFLLNEEIIVNRFEIFICIVISKFQAHFSFKRHKRRKARATKETN